MTITTDFAGNEATATVKTRLAAILDYYNGAGSTAAYTTWGDARTAINTLAPAAYDVADGEIASSFRPKLNWLNDPDQIKFRMTHGRVDFVGIGDSNQLLSGIGWDHGFQKALIGAGYPMWATGLVSQNENAGSGAAQGYKYNRGGAVMGATTGAPTDLADFLNVGSGNLFPASYTYVSGSISNGFACGLFLEADSPLDNGAALEFDIWWGSFASGSGTFRPWARLEQAPFSAINNLPTISTNTGVLGNMACATLTLPVDATRTAKPISGKPLVTGVEGITGPYFSTYYRFRNPGRTTGFSYGTLDYRGGQSTRTVAYDLQQASDDTLTHYFGILRADQDQDLKTIVITISEGLNDRNETLASVGPGAVADGDSPEAFVDNHTAIVERIQAIWTLNGWDQTELFWLFMPSHPVSDPDDAELLLYRSALATYVASLDHAQIVDLESLTDEATMLANSWYASGGADRSHLTQDGYEDLAALAIADID